MILTINNRPYDYECEIEPIIDEEKNIKLLFFRFNDISKFVKAQKDLDIKIRDMTKHKNYLEKSVVPIFVIDINGKVIFWNQASHDLFGYSEIQAKDKFFIRLIGITDQNYFNNIKTELTKSKLIESTFKIISTIGNEEILSASFALVEDNEPFIVVSCQKITEKVQFENKIKADDTRFKHIIHHSGIIIFNTDINGKFIYANKAFLNLIDSSEE